MAESQREALAKLPAFKAIAAETADNLPGLAEMLKTFASSEMTMLGKKPAEEDDD